jgi:homoserine/homoserine lactone efflux protein
VNWELFAGFFALTVVLVLIPGPIVTLVIATGATFGVRAGLLTVAGTTVGNAVLVALIAAGLSWVVAHALYVFEVLRWIGALYLVWLGVRAWRNAGQGRPVAPGARVYFRRGFAVALSNPKTIAFFTAFLPQFVDPALPAGRQLAAMCTVAVLLAALSDSCWAIAAGLGRGWLVSPRRSRILARASGLTLIGAGIWLSLARRPA